MTFQKHWAAIRLLLAICCGKMDETKGSRSFYSTSFGDSPGDAAKNKCQENTVVSELAEPVRIRNSIDLHLFSGL